MSKAVRQRRILDLVVGHGPIGSQDELRRELVKAGYQVTQATLSRDIAELGLVKTTDGYAVPENGENGSRGLPSLERMLREFVTDLRPADNLLVVKTLPGAAQPVAAALDGEGWEELLGTIGGDDTILLIAGNAAGCKRLTERIREVIA
jgi:transcriptional regulator of arginine metabolism